MKSNESSMKHLTGKKVKVYCNSGKGFTGLVTSGSDEVLKILPEGKSDEMVIFVSNIFSYVVVGEGVSGGYSGLKAYVCRNDSISCNGRVKLSDHEISIGDMGCRVCSARTAAGRGFKCDFGCLGPLEVIPSKVQRILFNGMIVAKNEVNRNDRCGKAGKSESEDKRPEGEEDGVREGIGEAEGGTGGEEGGNQEPVRR